MAPTDEFLTNLLANDFIQWLTSMYMDNLGQFFYVFIGAIIFFTIYARYQNIWAPAILWILIGGFLIATMPIVSGVAVFMTIAGVAGLFFSLFTSRVQ